MPGHDHIHRPLDIPAGQPFPAKRMEARPVPHRPEEMRNKPAPSADPKKDVERIQKALGPHSQNCKISVHHNQMEVTFPCPTPCPLAIIMQTVARWAPQNKTVVSVVRDMLVVKIPNQGFQTEVLLPVNKGHHAMIHTDQPIFHPSEVQLCTQLIESMTVEDKTKGNENLQLDDIQKQLGEMGIEIFMPPVLSPALKGGKDAPAGRKVAKENVQCVAKLWAGIAGYNECKAAVKQSITLPLLRPDLFTRMAQLARGTECQPKTSNGVLFTGPPGVGKTSMAKVAAHAAGVPLVYVPVESIMSKWFGEAEQRLRQVFSLTRQLGRSVLFLDELDAFAGSRDRHMHEATRRILSVLLRQLDGLDAEQQQGSFLVMVGATNRPTDLDAALMSRFDQTIDFPLPTKEERAAIFGTYAGVLSQDELNQVAEATPGCAGRDIVELCKQAERMWLYKLLQGHDGMDCMMVSTSALRPPPLSIYLEAVSQHRAGNQPSSK